MGSEASFESLTAGKVVVIDFWATWCKPCRDTIPKVIRLAAAYEDTDLVVVGVHVGESRQEIRQYASDVGIEYPLFADPQFEFSDQLGARRVPAIVVVNRQREVVMRGSELDGPMLAAIRKTLGSH